MNEEKGALCVPGAQDLIVPMNNYVHSLEVEDVAGVLLTFDIHDADIYAGSPEDEIFPLHCERNKWGSESVIKRINDIKVPAYILEKGVFNMWEEETVCIGAAETYYNRELNNLIERDTFFAALLAGGITDVEIIGVASDYCVTWAADGFVKRGFNVTIRRDLVKGIAREIDQVVAEDYQGVTNICVI